MLDEKKFKIDLIDKLNSIHSGWRDGDLDQLNHKRVDIINDKLKIAIEIKDDIKFHINIANNKISDGLIDLKEKNRQFKYDIKNSNKKFKFYPNYKSVVILRTEMVNYGFSRKQLEYIVNGPISIEKNSNQITRSSTFFGNHDNSTKEVGGFLFLDNDAYKYIENKNPNINKNRILNKKEFEKYFLILFKKNTTNNINIKKCKICGSQFTHYEHGDPVCDKCIVKQEKIKIEKGVEIKKERHLCNKNETLFQKMIGWVIFIVLSIIILKFVYYMMFEYSLYDNGAPATPGYFDYDTPEDWN